MPDGRNGAQDFSASRRSCGSRCREPRAASGVSAGAGLPVGEGCRQLSFEKDRTRSGTARICSLVSKTCRGAGPSPWPPKPSSLPSYVASVHDPRTGNSSSSLVQGLDRSLGDRLFSRACCRRTRRNGFKLKEGRFRLDIRKKFFMMRVMEPWHRLPREVVDAPCLETFKVKLDGALSNLI